MQIQNSSVPNVKVIKLNGSSHSSMRPAVVAQSHQAADAADAPAAPAAPVEVING